MNFKRFFINLFKWESWHYHIKYIPIAPVWLWYCIKARSLWFFTASNPSITFGGFEGEGKWEIYEQLPEESYPKSIYIEPDLAFSEIKKMIDGAGLGYPLAAKPDVGMMGFMFRKISGENELEMYHKKIPVHYIIQELVNYPLEISLFYYRMPDSRKGTISGLLLKQPPEVTGDGKSSLGVLIEKNEDLKYKTDEMMGRFKMKLKMVLPKGKKLILSHASNRSQGGKLISLDHEIDEKLLDFFDDLSNHTKHFFYGRYDIKCSSIEDLKNGTGFSILEYNGAGAGIQHIYGNGLPLWKAWGIILKHWEMLYRISIYNHTVKGYPYPAFQNGRNFLIKAKQNLGLLKKIDNEFPVFS